MKINELNYIGNDDEFYTQEGNIVSELGHYTNDFNGAAIYLPCDNPHESKFFKYFKDNFSSLGIRKLCATFTSDAPYMTFYDGISTRTEPIQSGRFQDNVALMKDCDIVVTNPPFSDQQAIALIEMAMELGKDFIIVAPSSILRKPEIFEMLKGGEINVGYTSIGRFTRPVGPKKKASTVWLTSLSVDKPDFNTENEFDEIKHRKYDNYDAIDCGTKDFGTTYEDIPSGYDGNIGVTHSFLRRLNRNQYELVDILDRPVINGKELDTRFIIRLKQPVGVSESNLKTPLIREFKEVDMGIYMHKSQADAIKPGELVRRKKDFTENYSDARKLLDGSEYSDFNYNCVMWNYSKDSFRFDMSSDFDTNTEPGIDKYVSVGLTDGKITTGTTNAVWHGKEMWVNDDYDGFDVERAKKWRSRYKEELSKHKFINKQGKEQIPLPRGGSRFSWMMHLMDMGLIDEYFSENGIEDPIAYLKTLPKSDKLITKYKNMKKITEALNVDQEFTSKNTDMNWKRGNIASGFGYFGNHGKFASGATNLDIGGGRSDLAHEFLNSTFGAINLVFDPFNRSSDYNANTIARIEELGGADTVTCFNCLNVIKEPEVRDNIILQCAQALKPGGVAFFQMYVNRNEKNGPRATGGGKWQEFRDTETYVDEIKQHFATVTVEKAKGKQDKYIVAADPIDSEVQSQWRVDAEGTDWRTLNLKRRENESKIFSKKQLAEMRLITEGKREKQADDRSRQVIRDFFNNASWLDTEFVQFNDNPNHLSHLEYMFRAFKDEYYHNSPMCERPIMGFEPVFCRIAFENGFQQSNPNHEKLNRLKAILLLMDQLSVNGKIDLSKINKESITYESLDSEFGKMIDDIEAEQKQERDSKEYTLNEDYEIIGPVDYKTAHEYGNMSCPSSKLCYTQSEGTWNGYTSDGVNDAYIILKKGFENLDPVNDEGEPRHDSGFGNPYDTYGLSMIFVFINPKGNITTCNTRWNHYAKYTNTDCDHALNKNQISDIIGANFDKVFDVEERKEQERLRLQKFNNGLMSRLRNGEDPESVFDVVYGFYNGLARVKLNRKYNFIDTEGKIISDLWFDNCTDFVNGLAKVVLDDKCNYINTEGKLISDLWFDDCYGNIDGFIGVRLNRKYNFINTEGQIISDQWFDFCENFKNGFAKVHLNGKCNYINTEGQLMSDLWFDDTYPFFDGFAIVGIKGKGWNFINAEGQLISEQWFDACRNFGDGFAEVCLDHKYNFINTEGNVISNQWFDDNGIFCNGFAAVKLVDKWNYINTEGQLISDLWFDECRNFNHRGLARVKLGDKRNYINAEGQLISDLWFEVAAYFSDGFAAVKLDGKWNFINAEGKLLSEQWFDACRNFDDGFAYVEINGHVRYIDTQGNIYEEEPQTESRTFTKRQLTELRLITEGKREKQADNRSRQVIRDFFNNASWLDTEFVHFNDNPNHLSHLEYMFKAFKDEYYHNSPMCERPIMGFEPVFCRIAFENGFQQSNPNHEKLNRLKAILLLMDQLSVNGKIDLSKINKEAITYESLDSEFGKMIDDEEAAQKQERDSKEYTLNEDYEIIGPVDYDTAHEYGNMSCPSSKLCYTQSESTWGQYTNNGNNDAYIILKKGFENENPFYYEHDSGKGNPYDTYGLSMIFVFINPQGNITTCNTRWNHWAKYTDTDCDHALNKNQISDIIGANFDKVFGVDEIKERERLRILELNNNINERLRNGEDPQTIFDEYHTNKNGIAKVKLNGKWNFINTEGQLLSDQWFDGCARSTIKGFFIVRLDDKYNIINNEGHYLSDQWFDWCYDFQDNRYRLSIVKFDWKWNFINTEGQLISEQWYDECQPFNDGLAGVKLVDKWNFVNTEGQLLSDQWFDECDIFSEGFAAVKLGDKWNFVNTEGRLLSEQWYDECQLFGNGFAAVKLGDKWNFVNTEGRLLSEQWYDECQPFNDGFAEVKLGDKWNFVNTEGQLISEQWYDTCYTFMDGFAPVRLGDKWNLINAEGQLISDLWFDGCGSFYDGFAVICCGEKYNFISTEGQLLSKRWFNNCVHFKNGFAYVEINGHRRYIDTKGNLHTERPQTESRTFTKRQLTELRLITEGKREKQADDRSRQVIRNFFNDASWLDTEFVHNDNPNHLSHLEYMFKAFKDEYYHNSPMRERPIMGFEPVFCRIAFENGFQQSNPNHEKLNRLKSILLLMDQLSVNGKIVLSKINKDSITYESLDSEFGKMIDDEEAAQKQERDSKEYTLNEDYEIIGPVDYETAHKYGDMSCPSSKLCYTQSESTWGQYTNNGNNDAYIILKKDFENENPFYYEHDKGKGDPYDEYGLSMIFVFINPKGNITTCNTRWNHWAEYTNTDCDHALNKNQISDIIGANFDKIFGVDEKREQERLRIQKVNNDIMSRLRNGEDPYEIFDYFGTLNYGFIKVRIDELGYNFIDENNQLLSDEWFDNCSEFRYGFSRIEFDGKCNFLNRDGQLISDQWFEDASYFEEGFAAVKIIGGGWNFIDTEGNLLTNYNFDAVRSFYGDFALVYLESKGYNHIDKTGRIVSNQWYDICDNFSEGFAAVKVADKGWNFINTEGQLISDQWFDGRGQFKNGFACVSMHREHIWDNAVNFINTDGQLISDQWFDKCSNFIDGIAKVEIYAKGVNYINTNAQPISNMWFDDGECFEHGFAKVYCRDYGYNFINREGDLISRDWFCRAISFNSDGYGEVEVKVSEDDHLWYRIDGNGKLSEGPEVKPRRRRKRRQTSDY